jgi:hypothetical protein
MTRDDDGDDDVGPLGSSGFLLYGTVGYKRSKRDRKVSAKLLIRDLESVPSVYVENITWPTYVVLVIETLLNLGNVNLVNFRNTCSLHTTLPIPIDHHHHILIQFWEILSIVTAINIDLHRIGKRSGERPFTS